MESVLATTKGLADGNRMRVVAALMEHHELCVCQLTELLGLAGATVSRHMSILQNARLIQSRKQGRWVFYRLSDEFSELLRQWLRESLIHSVILQDDRKKLQTILATDTEEVCRRQRERTTCPT